MHDVTAPDLVAWSSSTGGLYDLPWQGGGFGPRVLVHAGLTYARLIAVGDITGDGHPDLVERGADGTVWVNPGDGHGHFGARVKAATGWQGYVSLF